MSDVTGVAGQVIANRYQLCELIGRGRSGCVWRATDWNLRTPVAVKLLAPLTKGAGTAHARFLRETRAVASLRDPNLVLILDHGVEGNVPYIVMEYLVGETLRARMERAWALDPFRTAFVLAPVLRAVARAHRAGIVHGNLRPQNIFLVRPKGSRKPPSVKVLDLCTARAVDAGLAAVEASELASARPFYLSPEQARGTEALDARSDLWSLAVITFECLLGQRPFVAHTRRKLVEQICVDPIVQPSTVGPVPDGFDAWFARATQRDPAHRFQDAHAFVGTLATVLTPGKPWFDRSTGEAREPDAGPARRRDPRPPKARSAKPGGSRKRGVVIAAGLGLVAAFALVIAVALVRETPRSAAPPSETSAPVATSAVTAPPSQPPPLAPASAEPTAAPAVVRPEPPRSGPGPLTSPRRTSPPAYVVMPRGAEETPRGPVESPRAPGYNPPFPLR